MTPSLTVYYDGICHLCSREIEHYKKHPQSYKIRWVDIADPNFDSDHEGIKLEELTKAMHVRKANGEIVKGIDSFDAIWETLEGYSFLRFLIRTQPLRSLLKLGYSAFANARPYLPKRKRNTCSTTHCPK